MAHSVPRRLLCAAAPPPPVAAAAAALASSSPPPALLPNLRFPANRSSLHDKTISIARLRATAADHAMRTSTLDERFGFAPPLSGDKDELEARLLAKADAMGLCRSMVAQALALNQLRQGSEDQEIYTTLNKQLDIKVRRFAYDMKRCQHMVDKLGGKALDEQSAEDLQVRGESVRMG